jgi:hypothetical protein
MTIKLVENSAVRICFLTSQNSTQVAAAHWLPGTIAGLRNASSSGFLLDSTQLFIDFPVDMADKVAFIVSWAATQQDDAGSLWLNVKAGDGWRDILGDYNLLLTESTAVTGGSTRCQLKKWLFGPFDSAQFVGVASSVSTAGAAVGDRCIRFGLSTALATGALTTEEYNKVHIQPFLMPVVEYDT